MTIREDADLHRAQRAFRCVLDAFAHPGTVHQLVPAPENPASPVALDASLELVVRLFVDQAVTFCVADSESGDEFPCGIEIVLVDPEGRIAAVPRSSSARRLADPATGFGADPASDLARDAATNPAPGLDPSTDPASMFHVKQSTQCSATKEQMFHVKHSESVPAEGFAPAATAASAAKGVR